MQLYFSHGVIWVFDADEVVPGNFWTQAHDDQKVCRRSTSANIHTLMEHGLAVVQPSTHQELASCEFLVWVSVRSASGRLCLGSVDPEGLTVWAGDPGWTRVGIGQDVVADKLRIRFVVEKAGTEEPTAVWLNGVRAEAELVETAEQVTF